MEWETASVSLAVCAEKGIRGGREEVGQLFGLCTALMPGTELWRSSPSFLVRQHVFAVSWACPIRGYFASVFMVERSGRKWRSSKSVVYFFAGIFSFILAKLYWKHTDKRLSLYNIPVGFAGKRSCPGLIASRTEKNRAGRSERNHWCVGSLFTTVHWQRYIT